MRGAVPFFANQILVNFNKNIHFYGKIVLKMTWLGKIGKVYRDFVENLRNNIKLRSRFC